MDDRGLHGWSSKLVILGLVHFCVRIDYAQSQPNARNALLWAGNGCTIESTYDRDLGLTWPAVVLC